MTRWHTAAEIRDAGGIPLAEASRLIAHVASGVGRAYRRAPEGCTLHGSIRAADVCVHEDGRAVLNGVGHHGAGGPRADTFGLAVVWVELVRGGPVELPDGHSDWVAELVGSLAGDGEAPVADMLERNPALAALLGARPPKTPLRRTAVSRLARRALAEDPRDRPTPALFGLELALTTPSVPLLAEGTRLREMWPELAHA